MINETVFANRNVYGYRYNINHPKVRELYQRYCNWKRINRPMTDEERFDFEAYIFDLIEKKNKKLD